jgi:hypothetical protein
VLEEEEDDDDDDGNGDWGRREEKLWVMEPIRTDMQNHKCSDYFYNTTIENDENSRPAKRWKLLLVNYQELNASGGANPNSNSDGLAASCHPIPQNLRWTMRIPRLRTQTRQLP